MTLPQAGQRLFILSCLSWTVISHSWPHAMQRQIMTLLLPSFTF